MRYALVAWNGERGIQEVVEWDGISPRGFGGRGMVPVMLYEHEDADTELDLARINEAGADYWRAGQP